MTGPRKKPTSAKEPRQKPKKGPKTKIRVDPHKEFAEAMKAQGVAMVGSLSNDESISNIRGRIPTGSLALDALLRNDAEPDGWAGIPMSRLTEIYGPPFIGKSTLADLIMGEVQRLGGEAVLADTEVSRDRIYSKRLGVDIEKLNYLEFQRGEMNLENVITAMYQSIDFWGKNYPNKPVAIVLDALGGTATREEHEKALGSGEKAPGPALAAKLMRRASRLFPGRLGGRKIAVVILNHEYESVGGFGGGFGSGPRKQTYGGGGVRHAGTLRVQLFSKGNQIKASDGSHLGREVVARLTKNRLGVQSIQEAVIPLLHGSGVENVYTLFADLKKAKIIVTGGSWSCINLDGDVFKFQGWSELKKKCAEHPTLYDRLTAVWKKVTYADLHV